MVDKDVEKYQATIAELRLRLSEAEESLQAIRSGEVDAFVVNTPTGDQIYTLQGTDTVYRKILEEMTEGAVTLSADNIILYCNLSFAKMVGGSLETVMGTNLFNYVSPSIFKDLEALVSGAMQRNGGATGEFRLLSLDSKETPVHASANMIAINGLKTMYIVFSDLTERERMVRRESENERFSAIGKVTAMVAHDLRGPLNIVSQATEMIEANPDRAPRMLVIIRENTSRALEILRDLRENTADLQIVKTNTDVDALVRGLLRSKMLPSTIIAKIESPGPTMVFLDSVQMSRVFSNLINNAVDAMPDGGSLSVEIRSPPGRVEIEFSDTGSGIPDSVVDNIFELFVSTKSKGTGLGLAICKRVVNAHGGEINFKTEKGKGTSFTIALPRAI